jgi:hypothetical protein
MLSLLGRKITPLTLSVEYLVVAGGGSGGFAYSGAGGAGGLLTGSTNVTVGSTYTVTVGAGSSGSTSQVLAAQGSSSVFSSFSATGGGPGSADNTTYSGA